MNVLIVDSDWNFADQARQYLEGRADNVSCQNSISAAIEHVSRGQADVVILAAESADDRLIRTIYSQSPPPAVLLTDHMDRFDRAWRAWQKCGEELLMKPLLKIDELHNSILAAMENSAAGKIIRHKRIAVSA